MRTCRRASTCSSKATGDHRRTRGVADILRQCRDRRFNELRQCDDELLDHHVDAQGHKHFKDECHRVADEPAHNADQTKLRADDREDQRSIALKRSDNHRTGKQDAEKGN